MCDLLQEVRGGGGVGGEHVVNSVEVRHAMRVRSAVATDDYVGFFSLLDSAPKMSHYLMQLVVPQIRFAGLKQIIKCYNPSVPLKHVSLALGLTDGEGERYLELCGAVTKDKKLLCGKVNFNLSPPEDEKDNLI